MSDQGQEPERAPVLTWVSPREAAERASASLSGVRKMYRGGRIRSRITADGGHREVVLEDVVARIEARRPQGQAQVTVQGPSPEVTTVPPPGTVLVPLDAWEATLRQLGHLHEAGQALAEARERAARAETEAEFLRERLRELQNEPEPTERESRRPDATQPRAGARGWLRRRFGA